MKNKIAIVMAMTALMVAALAAPMVMAADEEYTVSVVTSDIVVAPIDKEFGDLLAGASNELSPSLNLTNNGGAAADVDAKFTTNVSGFHGLVNATDVIGAGNFSIGTDGNEMALNNDGSDQPLGINNRVLAGKTISYDAILDVPTGQMVGSYSGNVRLTFTAVT